MGRVLAFLAKEIQWGKLAWVALGAALLGIVLSPGQLSILPLALFSLGGILVERMAPRHPFWNSLYYSLLGVTFITVLDLLRRLGANEPLPAWGDLGWEILLLGAFIIPQSLVGTWIGVTIRRIGDMARQKREQKGKEPPPRRGSREGPRAEKPGSGKEKRTKE